ncbi:methyltransferase [Auraticoccus sp. F435]|uniref:Methyltransferase n=1 Tax=Auraticoccus cholistanensis TaxID=2656650 RepID=A0A6A9UYS8_9ACTN|nr:HemK2/MTQ2 family protein methyltransferase [Auraticoccus cholistanensis]MVA77135.1 methyltransferase [Auraticoccus cholistanensis]
MAQTQAHAWFTPRGRRSEPPVALPGTYRVQHDSRLLATHVRGAAAGRRVLDVCTGTGFLALVAAHAGARSVVAVDLALRSVLSARLNAALCGAPVRVRRGNLFAPVAGSQFDLVVCNPPYVPSPNDVLPRHRTARCWDGGPTGRMVLDRFCAGVGEVLSPEGRVVLVQSTVTGVRETLQQLAEQGLDAEVVQEQVVPFGPVMTQRRQWLREQGLLTPEEQQETLVVVEGRRR